MGLDIVSFNCYNSHTMEVKKYSINFSREDIVTFHVNQWIMQWVRRYHPEAFDEAKKFVEKHLDELENKS